MTPTYIVPESEEHWLSLRTQHVTSTEVSALFNQSPYLTSFELWHRKAGRLHSDFQPNERTKWGTRLQDAIAIGVAADEGWRVRRMDEYGFLPDLRAGSSFDYALLGEAGSEARALLEIKNVDHWIAKEGWIVERQEDGTEYVEAPVHIELQIQHQMLVTGLPKCYLAALIGGNRIRLLEREADPVMHEAIRTAVAGFWASVDAGQEPQPDFVRDAAVIARLYGYAETGKVLDADADLSALAVRHATLGKDIRALESTRDALKAELLTKIGDAEKVIWDGGSISAGMVAEAEIAYTRKPYRNFRVNIKKAKAAAA